MAEVLVRSTHNLQQEIISEHHTLVADEPVAVGGDDAGPGPYELLLGALGACTSMTMLLYAQRKHWLIEGIEVYLRHGRDYVRDCAECEDKPMQIDKIERRITIRGALDNDQRARLLEIATKCPIHRTLTGTITIIDLSGANDFEAK